MVSRPVPNEVRRSSLSSWSITRRWCNSQQAPALMSGNSSRNNCDEVLSATSYLTPRLRSRAYSRNAARVKAHGDNLGDAKRC